MLAQGGRNPPTLPSEIYTQGKDRVVEIQRNVYAVWELPPGPYVVTALLNRAFGAARDKVLALKVIEQGPYRASLAQMEIACRPGGVLFIAVGDRGFGDLIVIRELTVTDGKAYIPNGVRSVGFTDDDAKSGLWYRDYPQ